MMATSKRPRSEALSSALQEVAPPADARGKVVASRIEEAMARQHTEDERKAIHTQLCLPAYDGVRAFTIKHGVSMTALMDAVAHRLGAQVDTQTEDLDAVTLALVATARRIDGERRLRPR